MRLIAAVLGGCFLISVIAGVIAAAWGRTPAGNTALIVPFSVGPALIAAGWAWLALADSGPDRRQVLVLSAAFGGAALVLTLLVAALPLLAVGSSAPPLAGLLALAIPVVAAAPVGMGLAGRAGRPRPGRGWGAMPLVVALLALLVMAPTGLAFVVAPLLVPVVLIAPFGPDLATTGAMSQRIAAGILLPILVIAGLFAGMSIIR